MELGIKTYRRGGAYYIAEAEKEKLESLFERYGLHEDGDEDAGGGQAPAQTGDNLPLLE